jgi:acetylornithine deacetylase
MTPLGPSPTVQASRLKRLIKSLMDIYSPSGKEEELVDFLFGYCRKRGLPAVRQEVDDGRHNLLLLPPDGSMEWALIGHLDTVSAYDLEDYGFREEDERILGLGAADMKAGCAAMVEAFSTAWEKLGSRVNCGVFLVLGEEEEGDGAKALVEEYHVPWAIIGEPTCLKPCLGQYGYIEVQILCTGRRVHASLASQVRGPVETMMVAVSELTKYLRVSRPEVVFNIRDLFSGPGGFAVPERCEALDRSPHAAMGLSRRATARHRGDSEPRGGRGETQGPFLHSAWRIPVAGEGPVCGSLEGDLPQAGIALGARALP